MRDWLIFNGEMVRAILDGRKTQVRLPITARNVWGCYPAARWWVGPSVNGGWWAVDSPGGPSEELRAACERDGVPGFPCPYGQPGDKLWVRETWWPNGSFVYNSPTSARCETSIRYQADDAQFWRQCGQEYRRQYRNPCRWMSPVCMPRWASRITLEITSRRVEPLQDISIEDAIAELGGRAAGIVNEIGHFGERWDCLYAKRGFGWDVNLWVWAMTFKALTK